MTHCSHAGVSFHSLPIYCVACHFSVPVRSSFYPNSRGGSHLFLWKALTEAMANIKLHKKTIVSFRFTVADESRLLVVLQFSFFFPCEKRTLFLMLNFNNYCLSLGRFPRLFTAYSL